MRFAIYARFSNERHQRATSIEDQVRLCRERVARLGGSVVEVYEDAGISGSHLRNRPDVLRLLEDARNRCFDAVICEDLDRASRGLADVAAMFDELRFHDIKLIDLGWGEINALTLGVKGGVSQHFLVQLAARVVRGQRGAVARGRAPGGISYGYRAIHRLDSKGEKERGLREVDEVKAAIVRRIFTEFAAGRSPRAIVADLNAEGIPGPRGGQWNISALNGGRKKGLGLLNNRLYIGELTYNRVPKRKHPGTGKRIGRVNARESWDVSAVPELRLVEQPLWEAVQARLDDNHRPLHQQRRPRRLFSGLLRCATCGGAYTLFAPGRYGCSTHRQTCTCANNRSISARRLETRVLDGLKAQMLHPELFKAFAERYREAVAERRAKAGTVAEGAAERLRQVEREIANLVAAVKAGGDFASLRQALTDLERERGRLKQTAEQAKAPSAEVVDLFPVLPERYRQRIQDLTAQVEPTSGASAAARAAATTMIRGLVEKIVIHPGAKHGETRLELHGRLAGILALGQAETGAAVAGGGANVISLYERVGAAEPDWAISHSAPLVIFL